jgi:hypothetical protein
VWIVKSPSAAEISCRVAFAGVKGNRRSNCDTVDGSNCNCELCECKSEWAINSLYLIGRVVICRMTYQTRDNIFRFL